MYLERGRVGRKALIVNFKQTHLISLIQKEGVDWLDLPK